MQSSFATFISLFIGLDDSKAELEAIRSDLSRLRSEGSSDFFLPIAENTFAEVAKRLDEAETAWNNVLEEFNKHKHPTGDELTSKRTFA